MKVVRYLFVFLLFFGIALAKEENLELLDKVAIIVNKDPILKSEIDLASKWFGVNDKKKVAEKLIDQILIYQEARKHNIRVLPQEVEQAILRLAIANGMKSIDEFKEFITKQGFAYSEFTDLIKREIMIGKYMQFILKPKVLQNIKEAKEEKYREVYILYLDKNSPDFENTYKKLKQKLNPKNFIEFAKKYSQDPITKEKGGYLGKVKKGELLKLLDEKVWSIKPKTVTKVKTDKGIYFVFVKSEEKKLIPKDINQKTLLKKLDEALKLEIKKLREKAVIQYLDKSLEG
ncbi:MAG TPA: peptidylprolyl isomerase [Persephonella sp.]|nr:peptidylprolyl isomerase [Hydrogenothermaceae bacterium]HIQ24604.1 peptidylprolyl isomerase [Persephonella sp.]